MRIQFKHEDGRLNGVAIRGAVHPSKGVLLLHPHPLYGGDMNSHVVRFLEEALSSIGLTTLRFDFRGTGSSVGQYSGLNGSIIDALSAITFMKEELDVEQLGVIGYSFGGSVTLGLITRMKPDFIVTMSASLNLLSESGVDPDNLNRFNNPALLIHGDNDKVVPFSDMDIISSKLEDAVESFIVESEGHYYTTSMSSVILRVVAFMHRVWGTNLLND
ncbi:MAG: dienelactone hydrolase family protein [Candidatus Thorarchaeota archaeon]|nr:dienelactone hydrolase family protein [Candidatus Thorarchaeota archaeon]